MNSLVERQEVRAVLDRLHAASDAQEADIGGYYAGGGARPTGFEGADQPGRLFWQDKFVALERDKAELVYALCRSVGATRIVEAGTSFGVSTIYLAAAAADNGGGRVTTCDIEAEKSDVARSNLTEAGLVDQVELLVGDVRDTLASADLQHVDVLLLDIWAPIAGEVAKLVGPRIRTGGLIIADNTASRRDLYGDLLDYLRDDANGFTSQTIPFDGGLELAVKTT